MRSRGSSALRVGYGRTRAHALRQLDAVLEADSRKSRSSTSTASYGSLPSLLDGDAVAYAALGPNTRSALANRAAGVSDSLAAVVEAADALGCALEAGSARSRLRYGVVTGPDRLSWETIRTLVDEATSGDHFLREPSIYRDGRTVVVDAAVETPSLWAAHKQIASDTPRPATSTD